ncbi:unnamed protein product, partial [Meganyctiphanes norvegica]
RRSVFICAVNMKQLLIVLLIIMGHQALAKPGRKKEEQAKPEWKEVQTKLEMREDEQINPKGREEEQVSTDFPFVQPKSERMEEEQAKPEGKEEHEQVSMLNLTMMSRSNGWPSGTYGLPKPKSSCPPSFKYGNRYHDTEDEDSYNGWSRNYLGGYRKRNNLRQDFCIKKSSSGSGNWPKGDYCIYKYGSCPPGFSDGSIYLDDEDSDNANKKSGSLPDGDYGRIHGTTTAAEMMRAVLLRWTYQLVVDSICSHTVMTNANR